MKEIEMNRTLNLHPEGIAFIDGSYVPIAEASIPLMDWGFTRGDACQDTVSVRNGAFFRLQDHLDRFEQSCARLRYTMPVERKGIETVLKSCVEMTGLANATVQMIMTRGLGPSGSRDPRLCKNRFMAFCVPFVVVANEEQRKRGLSVWISSRWRLPPDSVPSQVKNYNWIDFVLSLYDAYDAGCETSLMKNHLGTISEGPGFNVFALTGKVLSTPGYNVLEGITRRSVIEICREIGQPVDVKSISESDLISADELFACSTAGGIMPITSVNGKPIGSGKPGALTTRLGEIYWTKRDQGWHATPVDEL
ncbi:aminotransferase class IV [Mesorhizobium sp.]|uniref:aminotransferase class IV n=1 Tax=Mesorhizobium sp. TaxID=1871066 RepID=UPI00257D0D4E|nr:aminotransferase class IV [Mesorhizobium sp.]